MIWIVRVACWVLYVSVVAIFIAWLNRDSAFAEETDRGKWFKSLKTPGGASCCDVSDCRRTEAEWRGEQWWAVVEGQNGQKWTPIPPERVLKTPRSIDGEAYVCNSPGSQGGPTYGGGQMYNVPPSDPLIFCFIPPDMGY